MVGADVNKRICTPWPTRLTDDTDYAFTGIDVRYGWGGIISVTILGETKTASPAPRAVPSSRRSRWPSGPSATS